VTLPYLPRLLCISLATFFLIHLALALGVCTVARTAARFGERARPHIAARWLFVLRLLPSLGAASIVLFVCLPSYLWFEPDAPGERVSIACISTAVLGIAICGASLARGLRAVAVSRRLLSQCRIAGSPGHLAAGSESMDAWIFDGAAPLVALAGILRPRLIVSGRVLDALMPDQLAAALGHERAHWASRDNFKRLCILLAPDLLLFPASSRTLEHAWAKFAEWAADDRAVAGSPRRSLALAEALVRIARMAANEPASPLACPLLGDTHHLPARVDRLLRSAPPGPAPDRRPPIINVGAVLLLAALLMIVMLQPAALESVHQALEHLVG